MAGAGACAPDRQHGSCRPGDIGGEEKGVDVFLIYDIGKSAGIVEHPAFLNKPRTVAPVRGFFYGRFSGDSEPGGPACCGWCSTGGERALFSVFFKRF